MECSVITVFLQAVSVFRRGHCNQSHLISRFFILEIVSAHVLLTRVSFSYVVARVNLTEMRRNPVYATTYIVCNTLLMGMHYVLYTVLKTSTELVCIVKHYF
jgi:hypothetical protein